MITHYIFFRYREGFLTDAVTDEMNAMFTKVIRDVPGAIDFTIQRSSFSRKTSMDVMVKMSLADREALETYAKHPAHVELSNRYAPDITSMCTFDIEN